MPIAIWNHPCCAPEGRAFDGPECPQCGQMGRVAGCHLTVDEDHTRYERAFGLKAHGPHRHLARILLEPLRVKCEMCGGSGILWYRETWVYCFNCEGGGGTWGAPEQTLVARYRRILDDFPEAEIEGGLRQLRLIPDLELGPPPPGYSRHGLRILDVQWAFLAAQNDFGPRWRMKGNYRFRWASLDRSYAESVGRIVASRKWLKDPGVYVYPYPLIQRAAMKLGVKPSLLMGKMY